MTSLDDWARIGEIVTGVAATAALLLGIFQIRFQNKIARDARRDASGEAAYRAYDDYVRICIECPELTSFDIAKKYLAFENIDDIWNSSTKDSERYLWFIANMLNTFERILRFAPDASLWEGALNDQIGFHQPIFGPIWNQYWRNDYGNVLVKMVDDALEAWLVAKALKEHSDAEA